MANRIAWMALGLALAALILVLRKTTPRVELIFPNDSPGTIDERIPFGVN